jgi:hypothetical protein
MNKTMLSTLLVTLLALPNVSAADDAKSQPANGSIIVAEGFSAANTYPIDDIPADINGFSFVDWCNDVPAGQPTCIPTVELEVFDVKKGKSIGFVYAWGKEFGGSADGVTLVFKEFILLELQGGQLYTLSQEGGHPGGAFADPSIIIPKQGDQVLLGGAEGVVLGGTGVYAGASGAYSTRLKVEVDFASGLFVYYDELYFRFREVFVKPRGKRSGDGDDDG